MVSSMHLISAKKKEVNHEKFLFISISMQSNLNRQSTENNGVTYSSFN